MRTKTAVSGSLSNKRALTDAEINAGFAFNTILESPDFNGQLFDIDEQVDIISKEICNFLTGHSVTPVGNDNTQLGTLLDSLFNAKQDTLVAGANITIDENNVISTTGATALNFPLFASMWMYCKPFNSSWVNANNYSWLYASMYVSAYNALVSQLHPTGKAEQGSTYYVLRFDNGEGETTNVLVGSGTLSDLQSYCTSKGYTYNAAGTIEEFECYKTLTTSSETVEGITITYYETYNGMKIITDAAEITNEETLYNLTGVDNYFILDEANNRFKLPRINPAKKDLITLMRAKGNGKILTFSIGTIEYGLTSGTDNGWSLRNSNNTTANIGASVSAVAGSTGKAYGLNTDSTKSGIVIDPADSDTVKDGSFTYLYFYLGDTGEVVDHQIASIALELFNGKADLDLNNVSTTSGLRKLVEVYNNGSSWYKVFEEFDATTGNYVGKWCEQGGKTSTRTSNSRITINLLKPFINTDYTILQSNIGGWTENESGTVSDIAQSSFGIFAWSGRASFWEARGYIS